eukprot:CAMPEP_0113567644 /NCGR_PEP_ID=MMETSP0015_2-20120614/23393_1 /TAXON_ID=2838 /ORGANISM="Odontella" /LENGTH=221 /DNA_ID=CAMNT_0000470067 /DNA_START=302 /DNA_END=963 /DNA_ORIENTATION=+ /assembly_acc=CAM_ASM_000160
MRFLLSASSKAAKAAATSTSASSSSANNAAVQTASSAASSHRAAASAASMITRAPPGGPGRRTEVSWGQRCSPVCGCVVRFESTSDATTGRIRTAEYTARSVVASSSEAPGGDGALRLRPQTAERKGRPLLTECECRTLHAVASALTSHLPGRTMDAVRNSSEFDGFRSSESFRRAALSSMGLTPTPSSGRCYDLVEEAFVAAVRGYVPGPRRSAAVAARA